MNNYLNKTKLSIPQNRSKIVKRIILTDKLDEGVKEKQLTLVSAPPGYGKTSLIAEWANKSALSFAWYSVDSGDNEPVRFFSYMLAALQQHDSNIGVALHSILDAPLFPQADMLAGVLANEIDEIPEKIVLVIDDFQNINNKIILETIRYLIENQPQKLHIVLITRQDPDIPLSRLRAGNRVIEIREADLRFSYDEAREFLCSTMNIDLKEEYIKLLERKTEGWAVGLQLGALSVQGKKEEALSGFFSDFGGTNRYIIDYLFEEAIGQLPENVMQFLAGTCVLERFNSRLCDELLARNDSSQIINRLLKSNLFIISLDEYGQWYRYHTLFRDILKTEISSEMKKELYFRASEWFERNMLYDEALTYVVAAENYEALEKILEKTAWSFIQRGEIKTLYDFIEKIPADSLEKNSEIKMYRAWCLLLTGNGKEAYKLLNEINFMDLFRYKPEIKANLLVLQIFRSVSFKETSELRMPLKAEEFIDSSDLVIRTSALYCMAQIRSFQSRLDESIHYYMDAYNTALKAGQYFMAMISVKNLSISLLLCGNKKNAAEICHTAMRELVDAREKLLPAAHILYIPLGMVYYSEDNLQKAYECLKNGIDTCRRLSLNHFAVQGEMSFSILQFALDDIEGALRTIHEACDTLKVLGMDIGVPMFTAIEAEFHLRNGNLEFAQKWAEKMGFNRSNMPGVIDERQYFTYTRLLICEGKYEEAESMLNRLEKLTADGGRVYRLITVYILQAVNFYKKNDYQKAAESLEKAVTVAAPESYYRLFLDEDACIAEILGKVRKIAPDFVDILSRKYHQEHEARNGSLPVQNYKAQDKDSGKHAVFPAEPLSVRELEILGLISEGMSNQEISDRLFISLGTTKWHITNIFSKLGVKNRVQAAEIGKSFLQG